MTEQPMPPGDAPQSGQKLRTLIFQGIIGAIALAGTTAIPLIIKQALERPATPASVPTAVPVVESTDTTSPTQLQTEISNPAIELIEETDDAAEEQGNGKDKPKKDKDRD